jgi:hypothetical protein
MAKKFSYLFQLGKCQFVVTENFWVANCLARTDKLNLHSLEECFHDIYISPIAKTKCSIHLSLASLQASKEEWESIRKFLVNHFQIHHIPVFVYQAQPELSEESK